MIVENDCSTCKYFEAHYILTENGYEKSPYGECGLKNRKKRYQTGKRCKKFSDNLFNKLLNPDFYAIKIYLMEYAEKIADFVEILKKDETRETRKALLRQMQEEKKEDFTPED